jgi:hypothetical protein
LGKSEGESRAKTQNDRKSHDAKTIPIACQHEWDNANRNSTPPKMAARFWTCEKIRELLLIQRSNLLGVETCQDSKISKSLAKVFVAYHREQAQISRLTVKILTRERKYRRKAALCANLISAKYLIARQIRHTRLVDKTADQPMIRRSLAS